MQNGDNLDLKTNCFDKDRLLRDHRIPFLARHEPESVDWPEAAAFMGWLKPCPPPFRKTRASPHH
jgi:hypothetical protein